MSADPAIHLPKSPIQLSHRASQTPASPIRRLAHLAHQAKEDGKKVYHLNIGQPDIHTPQEFFDGINTYSDSVVAYDISEGNERLRAAWTRFMEKTTGLVIPSEQMLITTGASEALIFTFMTCCDPDDEILIFDPTYANYIGFAAISGVRLVSLMTTLEEKFALPAVEKIEQSITSKTKAILLCNPNNPTGTVYSEAEVQRLLDLCNRKNLFLVVDEAYREFVYDKRKPFSVLHLDQNNERIIVIDSLSKRFSLCGARIGCMITPNQEVQARTLSIAQARLASPSIEQWACAHMLENISDSYIENVRKEYEHRRDTLFDAVSTIPGAVAQKPSGAFYCVVRLPVDNAEAFSSYMLSEFDLDGETVFLAPASGFYMQNGRGHNKVRIACVLNVEHIRRSVEIIQAGLAAYNAKKAD